MTGSSGLAAGWLSGWDWGWGWDWTATAGPLPAEEPVSPAEEPAVPEEKLPGIAVADVIYKDSIFPDCLAHWGSDVGLVQSVQMLNEAGEEGNYFSPYEKIRIRISFRNDTQIEPDKFSVAVRRSERRPRDHYDKKQENIHRHTVVSCYCSVSFFRMR